MQEIKENTMKDILLLGHAREESTRMKNKMTRSFADTTLFNIYLDKFETIINMDEHPFSDITIALSKKDAKLYAIAEASEIRITDRNDLSIIRSPRIETKALFHYLKDFDEEYVMWINGCFPFLKAETIVDMANHFIINNFKSMHCVKSRHNWFWYNNSKTPMNITPSILATQEQKPLLESVHCMHIFNRKYLLENNRLFRFIRNDPYLYELQDSIEFIDIDTENDFNICEAIYEKQA